MVAKMQFSAHARKYFNGLSWLAGSSHNPSLLSMSLRSSQKRCGRTGNRGGAALSSCSLPGFWPAGRGTCHPNQDHQSPLPCLVPKPSKSLRSTVDSVLRKSLRKWLLCVLSFPSPCLRAPPRVGEQQLHEV